MKRSEVYGQLSQYLNKQTEFANMFVHAFSEIKESTFVGRHIETGADIAAASFPLGSALFIGSKMGIFGVSKYAAAKVARQAATKATARKVVETFTRSRGIIAELAKHGDDIAVLTRIAEKRMANFVPKVGVVYNMARPSVANFLHAVQKYKNGPLSNVGRALAKHPNIIGESGNILQKLGGASNVNRVAAEALKNIMENGTMRQRMTKAFGEVIEYKLSNGLGARFNAITGDFIGFLGRGL